MDLTEQECTQFDVELINSIKAMKALSLEYRVDISDIISVVKIKNDAIRNDSCEKKTAEIIDRLDQVNAKLDMIIGDL